MGYKPLNAETIQSHLRHKELIPEVHKSVSSTNTLAKQAGEQGAPEGTVIIAEAQTAGRGRMGRNFFSPADTGIYFSVLLRPAFSPADSLLITTSAAVACAGAMEAVSGQETQIKWVNDIYVAQQKVCGILTEASLDPKNGGLRYAVLGIGINLIPPDGDFPEDIRGKAGALFSNDSGEDLRARLAAEILDRFFDEYPHILEKNFLEEYRRRSILTGRTVDVLRGSTVIPAVVQGIADDFSLIVTYADGHTEHLSSGEVSLEKIGQIC